MKNRIAILGNINPLYEPHYSMNAFLDGLEDRFNYEWVPTEVLVEDTAQVLKNFGGIIAGSGPYKSKEGVINGIRYARENNIPFLGTCSGFGYAVLEFGQSIFNLPGVHHPYERTDLEPGETFLQPLGFCSRDMHTISFKPLPGSLTGLIYGEVALVQEESHCYYGIKDEMVPVFGENGFVVSGRSDDGEAKIMEYNKNDFFIITLFLPQLNPRLTATHPLLKAFCNSVERVEMTKTVTPDH